MAGPDPAVAAARSALRVALADLRPGSQPGAGPPLVLVACSGGPDSLALAATAAHVAPRLGVRAGAVVVDHGWHPGSARLSAGVAAACAGLGLDPVEVATPGRDGPAPPATGGGPEARARTERYAALDASAEQHGALAVLLGHTLDDQAETVLLGLARGSGARSLAGMAPRRGRYLRPFLGLRRELTVAVCDALGLRPWADPANADPAYTRARVRSALPVLADALGSGLVEALARSAEQLREDADALDELATDLLRRACRPVDGVAGARVALDVPTLAAAADAVRRRALLQALRAAGAPAGALARRHVLAVDALVVAWRGQGAAHLPGGVLARRECGTLALARPGGSSRPDPPSRPDVQPDLQE